MSAIVDPLLALSAVPTAFLGVECVMALRDHPLAGTPEAPPFAVIVPAHNEEAGIAAALAAAHVQLRPVDRLVVVADNCTDDTAAIARRAGAECVVRTCSELRGKGFALAAGRDALRSGGAPVAVVIVLDADCTPDPGALPLLAALAARDDAVLQGLYLLEAKADASITARVSTFAFLVKNWVRQRGLRTLGSPVLLQGSGMAFPWDIFDVAPLASGDLVEDLELGLALAISGVRVDFAEQARFRSQASAMTALRAQRTRWEHGSIAVALRFAPQLVRASLRGRFALVGLLLDLTVPPLALLGLALGTMLLAGILVWQTGGGGGLALGAAIQIAWLGTAIGLAWARFGRSILSLRALLHAPFYVLWKIPIYLRLVGRRERKWIRTTREINS